MIVNNMDSARELLETLNVKATLPQTVDVLLNAIVGSLSEDDAVDKETTEFIDKFRSEMESRFNDLIEHSVQVYSENFTVSELQSLTEFYRTPVGRKYISKVPLLAQAGAEFGVELGQEIARKIIADMSEFEDDELWSGSD